MWDAVLKLMTTEAEKGDADRIQKLQRNQDAVGIGSCAETVPTNLSSRLVGLLDIDNLGPMHVDDMDEGNVSDGLSPENRSRQYCSKIASEELKRYRKPSLDNYQTWKQRDEKPSNPLDWWRENEMKYPLLSSIAKRYLSIPATSAPIERLFSQMGLIITKKRSCLRGSTASALGFLKGTWTETPEDLNDLDEDFIATDCESPLQCQRSDPSSLMFHDSAGDLDDDGNS